MKVHAVLLGDGAYLVLRDDSFFLQIDFVTHDDHGRVLVLHLVDALDPVRDRLVRLVVGHVETQDDPVSLTIKLVGYVPELFLACCVPYLDLDLAVIFLVVILGLNVVNGYSLEVIGYEFTLVKMAQDGCFANGCVTKHDEINLLLNHIFYKLFQ